MRKNILITGMPRSGKSTLLKKIISKIEDKVGFITNEIRKNKERIGFEIETNTGKKIMLADTENKTNLQVSKYYVHIDNLNTILTEMDDFQEEQLIYMDEIGQMQLFSDQFKQMTVKYLDTPNTCIATLSKIYSDDFIEKIKQRDDIFLIEITEENRAEKQEFIEELIKKISKAKGYSKQSEKFIREKNKIILHSQHNTRILEKQDGIWNCTCDFYRKYQTCSHIIALEEFIKINPSDL